MLYRASNQTSHESAFSSGESRWDSGGRSNLPLIQNYFICMMNVNRVKLKFALVYIFFHTFAIDICCGYSLEPVPGQTTVLISGHNLWCFSQYEKIAILLLKGVKIRVY